MFEYFHTYRFNLQNKSILEQMAEASKAAYLDCFQAGHVVTNSCLMILAGHETTASAVTFTSHLLALHPEVQEKLAEEIDNYRQEHPVRLSYIHKSGWYATNMTTFHV